MLSFDEKSFLLNDVRFFLNSGEIHYFRLNPSCWEDHLKKAVAAGLNAVSTYIPWDWHEYECGRFDFIGQTDPQRDLLYWIELCEQYGLFLIVKPGPFILAEYRGAGIPQWFIDRFGAECFTKNSRGDTVHTDCMTFFDSTYLDSVRKWYDQIIPFLSKHTLENSGPIIMTQVCNEIGVFTWLEKQADYSAICLERYRDFLKRKHGSIDQINRLYGKTFDNFQSLIPPSDDNSRAMTSLSELAQSIDWHDFWRVYYRDYLNTLVQWMHERGLKTPIYHNLPGWIYGRGVEFPVNITMYSELYRQTEPRILFGVDHIPEICSYRNAHDADIINGITRAMNAESVPIFGAEFQSGSREYTVCPSAREMALFYKSSLIGGLKAWNYYMFSSGKNQRKKGFSGTDFYWHCPLNESAEESSAYPLVKDTSALIKHLSQEILETERQAEIAVLFYDRHYATEVERPIDRLACGLKWQTSLLRSSGYFDGLLRALHDENIDHDIVDLRSASLEKLSSYKQVWFFSTEICDATCQKKLLDYIAYGGQLMVYPSLPFLDENAQKCLTLRDALHFSDSDTFLENIAPLVDCLGEEDVKCLNPIAVMPPSLESIARVEEHSVGCRIAHGKGEAIVLGFCLGYDTRKHRQIYSSLCSLSSARLRWVEGSNPQIILRQNFSDDRKHSLLFVGNYHNAPQHCSLHYTHPRTQKKIKIPYLADSLKIPQTHGFLSPVYKELASGLFLVHTSSDFMGASENKEKNCIHILLKGDRDLFGELLLEGDRLKTLRSVFLAEKSVKILKKDDLVCLEYEHFHEKSFVLTLQF